MFFFFILYRKKRHGNIPLRRKGNKTICSIALFSLVLCFDQFCIYFPKLIVNGIPVQDKLSKTNRKPITARVNDYTKLKVSGSVGLDYQNSFAGV